MVENDNTIILYLNLKLIKSWSLCTELTFMDHMTIIIVGYILYLGLMVVPEAGG